VGCDSLGGVGGLWSALQFLTRLPVPRGEYKIEQAYVWLPSVGLLLGAILALADLGLRQTALTSLEIATLLVVLLLALTGALHADGLMDTCDAVFSHATPERRLEIMRDPRAGTFGVVAIISIVALKIAAVDALTDTNGVRWQALLLAPLLGRWCISLVSSIFPYARPTGLGAPLKTAASTRNLALAALVPLAACLAIQPLAAVLTALATLAALAIGRWLVRLLPGLTGDSYGAICEVAETVVLLSAAPVARALG
jgi:adenosylcobinamide-GDP ribazoletransferase